MNSRQNVSSRCIDFGVRPFLGIKLQTTSRQIVFQAQLYAD
jgi:hypothetical protein